MQPSCSPVSDFLGSLPCPPPPIYAPNQPSPFGRFPCWPLQGMREEGDCLLEGLLSSFYLAYFKIKRHSLFVLKEQLKINRPVRLTLSTQCSVSKHFFQPFPRAATSHFKSVKAALVKPFRPCYAVLLIIGYGGKNFFF